MATSKTATLMLRLDPAVKRGLQAIAAREHRSLSNMIEVLIHDGCRRHGVSVSASCAARAPDALPEAAFRQPDPPAPAGGS
jgi:hypothetical protein